MEKSSPATAPFITFMTKKSSKTWWVFCMVISLTLDFNALKSMQHSISIPKNQIKFIFPGAIVLRLFVPCVTENKMFNSIALTVMNAASAELVEQRTFSIVINVDVTIL